MTQHNACGRALSCAALALSCAALVACGDEGGATNENEVITTVILNFEPVVGPAVTATFNDPDGDGGAAPTIDPVNLSPGNYALSVQFQNRLVTPTEELTEEVSEESDVHLVLFTGSAVVGPATANNTGPLMHVYGDADGNGYPVGLINAVVARAGTGQLTVTLRHIPPEAPPVKSADTVTQVRTGGIDAIGGTTDAQVNFTVTVQ
jgi:hypothetical protein